MIRTVLFAFAMNILAAGIAEGQPSKVPPPEGTLESKKTVYYLNYWCEEWTDSATVTENQAAVLAKTLQSFGAKTKLLKVNPPLERFPNPNVQLVYIKVQFRLDGIKSEVVKGELATTLRTRELQQFGFDVERTKDAPLKKIPVLEVSATLPAESEWSGSIVHNGKLLPVEITLLNRSGSVEGVLTFTHQPVKDITGKLGQPVVHSARIKGSIRDNKVALVSTEVLKGAPYKGVIYEMKFDSEKSLRGQWVYKADDQAGKINLTKSSR